MKKLFFALVLLLLLCSVQAQEEKVQIVVYYDIECHVCHGAMDFIEELSVEDPYIELIKKEITTNQTNLAEYIAKMKELGTTKAVVPLILIKERSMVGYESNETSGEILKQWIQSCKDECKIGEYATETTTQQSINHPLFGKIDFSGIGLPLLAVVLGLLDGFNPCAMWVLVYLISVLIVTKDKKKIWLIVGTFLLASGIIYFFLLTAWLNLFLFLGYLEIIRRIVGLIAIAAGAWHLYEAFFVKGCAVGDAKSKLNTMNKIKGLAESAVVPATIIGIIILAFSVNAVEFVCSAGIPAVFTNILASSNLSFIEYYLYILVYDLFFMLDDLIIFGIAAFALQKIDLTNKYVKWAAIAGGVLLILLGIALIFFPELLVFQTISATA